MMDRILATALAVVCLLVPSMQNASAQFRKEAFSQQYNNDTESKDSADVLFSFKEYFGGLGHKNELKPGTLAAGSAVFIGGCQIYNKHYWKLPIVYSTIFGSLGAGIVLNSKGNTEAAKYCFIGSGVAYWATMMDGVACYKADWPKPGKATLYSILVPGLGQIYNREYWKVPIYIGGMVASYYFYDQNKTQYARWSRNYQEAITQGSQYQGTYTSEYCLYMRNTYRRYRDYSLLALAAVYLIQVIDANVFSYMHNFEVTDDLAMKVTPTVIMPENQYAFNPVSSQPAFGFSLGFSF